MKPKQRAHVCHELRIAMKDAPMTYGRLLRDLRALNVPDNAVIRTAEGIGWRLPENVSFCRTENEISLW